MTESKDKNKKNSLKNLSLISQVGISVVSPILLCVFIGIKLEEYFKSNGLIILILILLGTGAGFMNLLKTVGMISNNSKKNDNNESQKDNYKE